LRVRSAALAFPGYRHGQRHRADLAQARGNNGNRPQVAFSRGAQLSPSEVSAVAAYIWALSHPSATSSGQAR